MELPEVKKLNTKNLSRIFDSTTESYKFFWFGSLLNKIIEGRDEISFEEIICDMISSAWYMVSEYHLNLGPKDTMENLILSLKETIDLKSNENKEDIISFLTSTKDKEIESKKKRLANEVPYRMQSTFLSLSSSDWQKGSVKRIELINKHEGLIYTFSAFSGLSTTILVNKDWADYIRSNASFLEGWYKFSLISYLQKRNPSVPGIPDKLSPPMERKLSDVTLFWKDMIQIQTIREIYQDKTLDTSDISIDHFIPWSYTASDEFWNLTPTTKSINSSKGNSLPSWEKFFPKLSEMEYLVYSTITTYPQIRDRFEKIAPKHFSSLEEKEKLFGRKNMDERVFSHTLQDILEPQYKAAENCGFALWEM